MAKADATGAKKRRDWEDNHERLKLAYAELLKKLKRSPSLRELEEATGLNWRTIQRHLEALRGDRTRFERFRLQTEEVLQGLANAGKKGDSRAAKLYFQFVEEWVEQKNIRMTQTNPYADLPDEDLDKQIQKRTNGSIPTEDPAAEPSGED